jgi:nitric oxide reductase NorE protein
MKESGTTVNTPGFIDPKNIFYPPGGILLWIVILLELLTFGIALLAFAFTYKTEQALFHQSAMKLNTVLGSVNTIVLLTSGYFMALSLQLFKDKKFEKSKSFFQLTLLSGLIFISIKIVEYHQKVSEGLTLGSNTFMDFYWLLTGFHLIHIVIGMVILIWIYFSRKNKSYHNAKLDFEAGAAFWHLCDLIWLLLFPVLYLIF